MLRSCVIDRLRVLSFIGILVAAGCGGASGTGDDGAGGEAGEGGGAGEAGGEGGGQQEGGAGGNSVQGGAGGKGGASAAGGKGGSNQGGSGGSGGTTSGGGSGGTNSGGQGGAVAASPLEFFKNECASCHGEKGEGTKDGPEIQHPVRAFAKEVIRKGRTGHPDYDDDMAAFSSTVLPDASLNAIFDYLDSPPKPTTGKALYVDFCQNCHGTKGNNGLAAHSVTTHIADIPRLVRSGHGGTSYLSRTSYMPAWTAQQLSDAELKLIADAVPNL
ncbi:MAG: c-type cytochrome [Deltaproteobacteria bacterium]|nr:c-type cytochrome [Deltaproteobacteria bacterium]